MELSTPSKFAPKIPKEKTEGEIVSCIVSQIEDSLNQQSNEGKTVRESGDFISASADGNFSREVVGKVCLMYEKVGWKSVKFKQKQTEHRDGTDYYTKFNFYL